MTMNYCRYLTSQSQQLAPGIDCPEDALYLPVLVEEFEAVGHTEPNHMCIFEVSCGLDT